MERKKNKSTDSHPKSLWQPKRSRLLTATWLVVLISTVFVWSCKKDNYTGATEGICPIVVSTDPANGATNVATIKKVSATFNEVMDPATLNSTTFTLKQGTTPIAGTITYTGMTATFSPTNALAANTVYTGTITTGAKDPAGNALVADYVWSFNTGTIPIVVSTDPANGATNVPLGKIITATFSTAMDPATINATTFTIKQGTSVVPGTITYAGMIATFTPAAPLAPNSVFTGTITTGAKDLAGNAMALNYTWSFATGALPTVISTDPANGATNVAINKIVTAKFSTGMNPATINGTTFTLKQGTTAVAGTVTYSGTTATFTPAANLLSNTVYTGTITTGAKDTVGNALAADYVWSFTTAVAIDNTAPTVVSTDPINNATGVPVNKIITATFSEAMNPGTINTNTFLLKQGAISIPGTVTYAGTTASFTPSSNLSANTTYNATITTGSQDLAGNALANNYVWSFTTAGSPSPVLGTVALFGVFGGSAGITNQGTNTVINNGSIGTTGVSTMVTGFHDGTTGDIYTETPLNIGLVTGRIHTAPPPPGSAASFAIATQGLSDANALYLSISPASRPGGLDPGSGELGGLTLAPGVYKSAGGTFKVTNGNLVLDAQGNPNAEWIFQSPTSLTVGIAGPAGARSVTLINGGQAKNVYWYVGSAATINGAGGGIMSGTIVSSAGMTFSTAGNAVQTVLNGRAISLNASVTLVNTTINVQ
ncbi:MAG: hypothetical protein JWP69_201 [Flaviaesturariibacter sp.]|nr:hypothetical protein [Flaviaesturariibacter sp.]